MNDRVDIRQALDQDLRSKIRLENYSTVEQLVLACRMLAAEQHWRNGLAGQITEIGRAHV